MMDFFTDDMRRNPYPMYEQMRRVSPVLFVPPLDLWMLFDYDCVKRALNDHESFSSSVTPPTGKAPDWLIFLDPPRHAALRAIIMRAFTPRSIANLEPRVRALSTELLDATVTSGTMDLVADYAAPLPTMVIAEMLGIPPGDRERFFRWSHAIMNLSYSVVGGETAARAVSEYFIVREEMKAWLPVLLEPRRAAPRDDLLTRLVEAEVDGARLTEEEILGFFQLLLSAGTETTTNLISNAVLALLEHPDQLAKLRATPALLATALEEVLRHRSPAQLMFRETRHDVRMNGEMIPAGKMVLAIVGAANRDPAHFADPERFDIARDPNPHIAFGHGIHYCIGAALARLESRVALSHLLARLPGLELACDAPWEPRKALLVHGPARLPIRFESASDR